MGAQNYLDTYLLENGMATDIQGKILTVTGPIAPGDLGKTLIHEHLFFDLTCYFRPPEDQRGRSLVDEPLQLSNMGLVAAETS